MTDFSQVVFSFDMFRHFTMRVHVERGKAFSRLMQGKQKMLVSTHRKPKQRIEPFFYRCSNKYVISATVFFRELLLTFHFALLLTADDTAWLFISPIPTDCDPPLHLRFFYLSWKYFLRSQLACIFRLENENNFLVIYRHFDAIESFLPNSSSSWYYHSGGLLSLLDSQR